jgi:hypothetical protein
MQKTSGGLGFYPQQNNYDYEFKQWVKRLI